MNYDNQEVVILPNITVEVRPEASYPDDLLSHEQIRGGGFILYVFGKRLHSLNLLAIMYFFYGISLATQNYINPSIDIIKAKGVVSQLY